MKYMVTLLLLFAVGITLILTPPWRGKNVGQPRERIPDYSWSEMSDIFDREQDLDDELQKIQFYHKKRAAILSRLSKERLSLVDAATALDKDAHENHPLLRNALAGRYPSHSAVERMALLLLEHMEGDGCKCEVIERFRNEMTTWSKVDPALFRQPRTR